MNEYNITVNMITTTCFLHYTCILLYCFFKQQNQNSDKLCIEWSGVSEDCIAWIKKKRTNKSVDCFWLHVNFCLQN